MVVYREVSLEILFGDMKIIDISEDLKWTKEQEKDSITEFKRNWETERKS